MSSADFDAALHAACDQFLAQVKAQLPLERLAVALLDSEHETGRVAYSWRAPPGRGLAQAGANLTARTGRQGRGQALGLGVKGPGLAVGALPVAGNDCRAAISVTLQGSQEVLGAVLLQAPPDDCYGPGEQRLVRRLAKPLALALDNLRLQQRLQRRAEEAGALQRIAESAASSPDIDRLYRRFAAQVKRLVEYQHLGIYTVDAEAGHLQRVSHGGPLAPNPKVGRVRALSEQIWAARALQGDGHIVDDLTAAGPPAQAWPGEVAEAGLRCALTMPVVCSGSVVGVVRLSQRRAGAYQPHHLPLVKKAAHLLGPSMAHAQLQTRLNYQSALEDKIARAGLAYASSQELDVAFQLFASALADIVPVEWVTLSWDGGTGRHFHTMTAQPGAGHCHEDGAMPAGLATISSPLWLGDYPVGVLTAGRIQPPFNAREQTLLDRVAVQIAAPVQSHLHYRRARSQAYQIEQLRRQLAPEAPWGADPEADRDLLVDAAHALRNPLTAIKGFSSSLLQNDLTWSSEDQQEFLQTIDRETDRLERVVRDLLAPGSER